MVGTAPARTTSASALDDAVAGTDVVESVSLTEALDDLGDLDHYSAEAVERFADDGPGAALTCAATWASRCPSSSCGSCASTGLEVEAALGSPDCRGPAAARPARLPRPRRRLHRAGRPAHAGGVPGAPARRRALRHRPRARGDRPGRRGPAAHRPQGQGSGVRVRLRAVRRGGARFPAVAAGRSGPPAPARCRGRCATTAPIRPRVLPGARGGPTGQALRRVPEGARRSSAELESQRLAYVAFTRAEQGLAVSGHWWGPTQSTRRGPDGFLSTVHQACLDGFGEVVALGARARGGRREPAGAGSLRAAGLAAGTGPRAPRRACVRSPPRSPSVPPMQPALPGVDLPVSAAGGSAAERARIQEWDVLASALLEEARARHARERVVRLPDSVSASLLMRAIAEPERGGDGDRPARCRTRRLRLPVAAPSSTPGSRRGTGSSRCSISTTCPGRPTPTSRPTTPCGALKEAFDGRPVRAPRAGGRGGAVRPAGRRPGRQRAHRRGVRGRGARHRLRRHRLEDRVGSRHVDPDAAGPVPAGVGPADGRARRAGVRGLRHRRHRRGPASGHRAGAGRPAAD